MSGSRNQHGLEQSSGRHSKPSRSPATIVDKWARQSGDDR